MKRRHSTADTGAAPAAPRRVFRSDAPPKSVPLPKRMKRPRVDLNTRDLTRAEDFPPWTGPVVRFADLSDDERARLGASAPLPCITLTRCASCGEFPTHGSRRAGRCLVCNAPLP